MSQYLLPNASINSNHGIKPSHTSSHIKPSIIKPIKPLKPSKPPTKSIPKSSMSYLTNTSPTPNTTNSNNASNKYNPFTNNANNNNNTNINNKTNKNNNLIKVQTEFMEAMTNAIIRYIDKNMDSSKSEAELSVFINLGYNQSIEMSNNNMEEKVNHFRRHHIMRNRDAIRTFRIKQITNNIIAKHTNYTTNDVLIHLTKKLNLLYLPSPSPPPPSPVPVSNINNIQKRKSAIIHVPKRDIHNENEPINSNNKLNILPNNISVKHIIKNNTNKINNLPKYGNTTNKSRPKQCKIMNKKKSNKPVINYNKCINRKQIYSTNNNTMSNKRLVNVKYKKKKRNSMNKKQLIKQKEINKKSASIYPTSFIYYSDQEIITQKIKLHSKSRKRKLNINSFDTYDPSHHSHAMNKHTFDAFNNEFDTFNNEFDNFDNKPPPKKRTRIDNNPIDNTQNEI